MIREESMVPSMARLVVVLLVPGVLASIETSNYKPDTRKCCLLSEVLVEVAPGNRRCTKVA